MSEFDASYVAVINEALKNVRDDRANIMVHVNSLGKSLEDKSYSEGGDVLCKLFNSLQKNNEQFLKIASTIKLSAPSDDDPNEDLTDEDLQSVLED